MKKKFIQTALIILSFCFSGFLHGQSLEKIIQQHIEAHGGLERWNEVNALKITGKFTAFSLENDYLAYKTREGAYYGDFYLGEIRVFEAFDGMSGWTIDPWQEIDYARRLNSVEENAFLQKADFFTPFLNYKEKGYTVEYEGIDTLEGQEVFVLKLSRSPGYSETWYLNTETYLEFICRSDWVDFARQAPAETFFDDFREVNGLVLPFFVERTFWQRDRILLVEEVEVNPSYDTELFDMPRREEMKELEFLTGDWEVHVEAMTPRGTWFDLGYSESHIAFVSENLLQETIRYDRIMPVGKIFSYAYNDDTEFYRVSVYNDLNTRLMVFQGTLTDTSFVFNNAGVSFEGLADEDKHLVQYTVSNIEDNGFVVMLSNSADQGETWNPRDRFTYTRKKEKDAIGPEDR